MSGKLIKSPFQKAISIAGLGLVATDFALHQNLTWQHIAMVFGCLLVSFEAQEEPENSRTLAKQKDVDELADKVSLIMLAGGYDRRE